MANIGGHLRGAVAHRGDVLEEDGPVLEDADNQVRKLLGPIDHHPRPDVEDGVVAT